MKTGTIYIIKNTINAKVYIGQTTMTLKQRFAIYRILKKFNVSVRPKIK